LLSSIDHTDRSPFAGFWAAFTSMSPPLANIMALAAQSSLPFFIVGCKGRRSPCRAYDEFPSNME
jgi:hypothetical protein